MITTYTITVNGNSYDVSVEKKAGSKTVSPVTPVAAALAEAGPVSVAKASPQNVAAGGSVIQVKAPMPGKVITVKIHVGDQVVKDQEMIVVEAMKMHNPILAPGSGVVKEIYVGAGDPVQTGQALIAIG